MPRRPDRAVATPASAWLLWQAWRWAGFTGSLARHGTAFLPRAASVPASAVEGIVDRRRLFAAAGTRRLRGLAGRVVPGDWDLAATPAGGHPALAAFERHFLGGAAWEETGYWREIVADVERGRRRVGCAGVAEVERKFRGFDALWRALGSADYRPGAGPGRYRPWEEVLLARDRRGGLLLVDGRHRLLLARVKRCRLPVLVVLRHAAAPRRPGQSLR